MLLSSWETTKHTTSLYLYLKNFFEKQHLFKLGFYNNTIVSVNIIIIIIWSSEILGKSIFGSETKENWSFNNEFWSNSLEKGEKLLIKLFFLLFIQWLGHFPLYLVTVNILSWNFNEP